MSIDKGRLAARLAAFTLVEAVQVDDMSGALAVAHADAIEQGWPEVTRVLLYAEVVRALVISDPDVGHTITALYDHAEAAGDRAMLSVALASRAEHRLSTADPLAWQGFEQDLARATALAQLSTDGALERATAYIACASAYSLRDLWEIEEELYAEVTPLLAECELPLLNAAVLFNRAEAALRLQCGLREVDATDEMRRLRHNAQAAIDAALAGDMPAAWTVEVLVHRHLLSALVDGHAAQPSAELDTLVADTLAVGFDYAFGLLRLADALCAADRADWQQVADQAEQALERLPARLASSARALVLRLAAQAEAQLGTVGAVHALRYAEYCSHRHWESRTQMVGAALASTHTEQLRIERDAHARNAMADELTGLANRRAYNRHLERLRRRRTRQPLAVLVIDIDNFKAVNDTHGHGAGDKVLIRVAHALTHGTRPTDLVARLGGDEFVAILADFDAEAATLRAAELVNRVAAEPWDLLAPDLHVSVSIGVAVWTHDGATGHDSEHLVARADAALYSAKALGGDRVEVAEEGEPALSV